MDLEPQDGNKSDVNNVQVIVNLLRNHSPWHSLCSPSKLEHIGVDDATQTLSQKEGRNHIQV